MSNKGNRYYPATWVAVIALAVLIFTPAVGSAADGTLQVTLEKGPSDPLEGVPVYLFDEMGTYLGQSQVTNATGLVEFIIAEGNYKVRFDYLGYQHWSPVYTVVGTTAETLTIAHQDVTITVEGDYQGTSPLSGVPVYLFTEAGAYMNQVVNTDGAGQAVFNLPGQSYKVRADYQTQQHWSSPFTWANTPVTIPMADAEILVTSSGLPLEGVNVYVFTGAGTYLNIFNPTGANGKVTFRVSAGDYKFRADYQSDQFWSAVEPLTAGQINPVSISTGGGVLTFTVEQAAGVPLVGVNCYAFTDTGTYLNLTQATDAGGQVAFNLADGSYKIRVDYLGYQFWSPVYTLASNLSETYLIAHQDVTITVEGDYQGTSPLSGVPVFLFTEAGAYMNQVVNTDGAGQVVFNLPEQSYKMRADYQTQQHWSSPFTWANTPVTIPMADAEILVTSSGLPLEGVNVYVFTGAGTYLNIFNPTGANGKVTFRVSAGDYKFRADYQSDQFWSGIESLTASQVNPVDISTGGGELTVTVEKEAGLPLVGVNCYAFTQSGIYLNLTQATDAQGNVEFNLADGIYKIRADYMGYQFWKENITIAAGNASETLLIVHQDVTITVEEDYPTTAPLSGVPVYLFTDAGAYMNQVLTTDGGGQVIFNLPGQSYKVRADYLGQQFWSSPFTWTDTTLTINRGMAEVHVTRSGSDAAGALVYLFSETGAYLNWFETTDVTGRAQFILPDRIYKFRADEGGDQVWSDNVQVTAGTTTNVEIELAPGANTPPIITIIEPDGVDDSADVDFTIRWSDEDIDDNATISIYYDTDTSGQDGTLIVGGLSEDPDGGAADEYLWATSQIPDGAYYIYAVIDDGVNAPVADYSAGSVTVTHDKGLALGFEVDEQQGGAGLVGETVRILNGNVLEFRSDLNFPSPHRMGLSFEAAYNSKSNHMGAFGYGWAHSYSTTLNPAYQLVGQTYLRIADPTGRTAYFTEDTPGIFTGEFHEKSEIRLEGSEYVWYRLDGSKYGFSTSGQLLWIDDEKDNRLAVAYDGQDRLDSVTDQSSGRVITFIYDADSRIESIAGPITPEVADGIYVTFSYDSDSNLTSVTYPDGSGFTYIYTDPADVHNLTEKRNKANHLINTWAYDGQDRCNDNFSRDGKDVTINYVSDSQVEVTDAYGTLRTYTITDISVRKRVTAMQGIAGTPYTTNNFARWAYDSQMNLTEVETTGGTLHQYMDYDGKGNPQTVIFAAGTPEERVIIYTYHPDMNVVLSRTEASVLGSGNKVTIWDYDDDGNSTANENPTVLLYRIIEQGFTRDAGGSIVPYEYITTFTYNAKGQVESIDGPLAGTDDTTTFAYDPVTGDLLSVTRPLIGITDFSDFDIAGKLGRLTDVNSRARTFTYDSRGRIIAITHEADSSTSSVLYNTAGLAETTTDEDGVFRSYDYDSVYGRLIQKTDTEGNFIEYTYDTQGNRIEMSKHDPTSTRTSRKRWSYQSPDIPGKLWREINADDTYVEYSYDSEGNISAVTDFNGNPTIYTYDVLNRLKMVTQPGIIVTNYTHDQYGNLESVTDANNNVTTYIYDDMGRVVSITSPDAGTTTFTYDSAGNPVQKTDTKGITITYIYDLLNRLTEVNFPDSNQDITYSYDQGADGMGRRTGITDLSGDIDFTYNSRGRLVGKTGTIMGYAYPLSRTFTSSGRLTSITYPSGRTIDYTRYSTGRIQGVNTTYNSSTLSLVNNLSYKPFSVAARLDIGSGGAVNNVTNEIGNLAVINPGEQMERQYTYEANRNLKTIRGANTPWYNQDFVYDPLNRLTSATGLYGTINYTYDDVGNRLTRTIDGQTETYTYVPGTNRLDQVSGIGDPVSHSYDANGNIVGMGNKTLVYNQNNRLIRVEENSNILGEYTYNGLGQRVIKSVGSATTIFHYDFDGNLIAESASDGTFSVEYLYVDQARMAMVDFASGTIYYFLNNYLGTPILMTDDTNTIVWEADYKPFGEAKINPNSEVVNNFRFAGQYYDAETGFHYNYHRYYNPKTGRYLKPDPMGLGSGINLYIYADLNPINTIDPWGLFTDPIRYPTLRGWYGSEWTPRKSMFGPVRKNPWHQGVDIYAPIGTDTVAAIGGEIVLAEYGHPTFGNQVIIKGQLNGQTVYLRYAHLSEIYLGYCVAEGQSIGKTGMSGFESGSRQEAHLHFEMMKVWDPDRSLGLPGMGSTGNQNRIDPYPYINWRIPEWPISDYKRS